MTRKNLAFIALLAGSMALQSCAHRELNSKVDREVSQESAIRSHSDLRSETTQLIESTPNLTAEQRDQLIRLRAKVVVKSNQLSEKSSRLKSLMVKKLLTIDSSTEEVTLLKSKIKDVENERLQHYL